MSAKTTKRIDITRLIKPEVRRLTAYHIDESPCRIKLDAMENPFVMPDEVGRDIIEAARKTQINRYPDPSGRKLKKAISDLWGMEPEHMMLGNGSDELIQAVILAFGGPVLTPVPTFAMYDITARALMQDVASVPLGRDFALDADRLLKKAREVKARVIFLACPNNPTGNRFSDEAVRKILDRANAAVVIDEAYFDFSRKTYLTLLEDCPNMIILRTLSKIGFAGLRVGVLTATPKVIDELNKIRLPYNINALSQAAAAAALRHRDVLDRQISLLISERQKLYNALTQLKGVAAYPSDTNFVLLRTEKNATDIYNRLKEQGILVKNLNRPGPLKNCLRVTVGRPEENSEFIAELKKILDTD